MASDDRVRAGLMAGLPRVNCWSIAEHAGEAGPRGMQRLLSAAVWDEAGMRDDLRGYVLEHFRRPGLLSVKPAVGHGRGAPVRLIIDPINKDLSI